MRQSAHCIARVNIDVGVATREYTFIAPFNCQVAELHCAADASDGTDYATTTVVYGANTLVTSAAVQAADAVTVTTGVDNGQLAFIPAGATFKLVVTFSGTAANVKGVNIALWVERKR